MLGRGLAQEYMFLEVAAELQISFSEVGITVVFMEVMEDPLPTSGITMLVVTD